jgi:hypothetical protein
MAKKPANMTQHALKFLVCNGIVLRSRAYLAGRFLNLVVDQQR